MTADPKLLRCCLSRRLEWREAEDGRAVVFRPRFGEGRFARWLESLFGLSPYLIRLDDIGTTVWKHCDGKASVQEIAELLRERFGDRVEPAEDRLQDFITQMQRARMIRVKDKTLESGHGPLD